MLTNLKRDGFVSYTYHKVDMYYATYHLVDAWENENPYPQIVYEDHQESLAFKQEWDKIRITLPFSNPLRDLMFFSIKEEGSCYDDGEYRIYENANGYKSAYEAWSKSEFFDPEDDDKQEYRKAEMYKVFADTLPYKSRILRYAPEYKLAIDEFTAYKKFIESLNFRDSKFNSMGNIIILEDGTFHVIGSINLAGGICDDCKGISDDAHIIGIYVFDTQQKGN